MSIKKALKSLHEIIFKKIIVELFQKNFENVVLKISVNSMVYGECDKMKSCPGKKSLSHCIAPKHLCFLFLLYFFFFF